MFNEFLVDKFSDGVRIIMITDRDKNKRQIISRHREQFINVVRYEMANLKPGYRIYSTLIKRNMTKAIHQFKMAQLEAERLRHIDTQRDIFYFKIEGNFISALMKPESRDKDDKKYLIDIDEFKNVFKVKEIIQNENIKVLGEYYTPNGVHIITLPFDKRKIEETKLAEVKSDGMILLGWNLPELSTEKLLFDIEFNPTKKD